MIAGQVFETIPPFDATASPTYGSGEFEGETYNRIVFHLAAPKDPIELEKWRAIIRAAGPTVDAQISLARPIPGATDALRMPTLVNADAIYSAGAKPVYRSLPLVPPFRQGAAIMAVVFTICAVLAAALGTSALRDGRGRQPSGRSRAAVESIAGCICMVADHLCRVLCLPLGING